MLPQGVLLPVGSAVKQMLAHQLAFGVSENNGSVKDRIELIQVGSQPAASTSKNIETQSHLDGERV